MKQIDAGKLPVVINEWDCSDIGTTINMFRGMCKGIIFKSVPNQDQFFRIRLIEAKGVLQQWDFRPAYQSQKLIFDEPRMIEIDVITKIPLLVSWRTALIILDEIIVDMEAHDPAEMVWFPVARNWIVPTNGGLSDPVYYYPLRSGHLRLRVDPVYPNQLPLLQCYSVCGSSGRSYPLTTLPWSVAVFGEHYPINQAITQQCREIPYLTQGLKYKFIVSQAEVSEESTIDIDVATIHGGFQE